MKISQDLQSQTIKQVRANANTKQSFDKIVQSTTQQLKQQEIQQLMKDITVQGDKLSRFRSFRDLAKFKRLVKDFLAETVYNGLDLEKSQHFGLEGHSQQLAIVKEVDEQLIQLTDDIINQERGTVDLLGIIGEIKGLLMSLYI